MRWRLILAAGLIPAILAFAEIPDDLRKVVTDAADALTNGDAVAFMDQFDSEMPGYAQLRANVEGLINENEVVSTVDTISDEGSDSRHSVELDWLLSLSDKDGQGVSKGMRRSIVKCTAERQGKRWKIVALEPVDFFRP